MKKLFWVDLEMTGLDPEVHVIIEFASIITDLDFQPLSSKEYVVFQPPEALALMDEWCVKTHGESGLTAKIPNGIPLADLEKAIIEDLDTHFGRKERPVLAGNSIHQDRKFIDRYMPLLADRLHYRMLDVSSYKIMFKNKYGLLFDKKTQHRALDDIKESISELEFYLNHFKIEN